MSEDISGASPSSNPYDESLLPSQTLSLANQLDPKLAQMLRGAWFAVIGSRHEDSFSQAANSARELIEKAPQYIPEAPIEQHKYVLNEEVKALQEAWSVIRAANWSPDHPWDGKNIDPSLSSWLNKAEEFFDKYSKSHPGRRKEIEVTIQALDKSGQTLPENLMAICHHRKEGEIEEFRSRLEELESFLLALIHPEPIPVLEELDELITEGEAA
jgi:hypothetical protein